MKTEKHSNTSNDKAWEKYISVKNLLLDGASYVVEASDLKEITQREPRLLTKYDEPKQLPKIFSKNGYCVLAITNGKYQLFKGNIFKEVVRCHQQNELFQPKTDFPLVTIGRGTGESEYLDYAYNIGLISYFTQINKLYLTIRGRERTRAFNFLLEENALSLNVEGVQIEVDAGYEGERDILLVEAKIGNRNHINVRQLYYPFRHFTQIAAKKRIRPLLFMYDISSGTYTFYEYRFSDPNYFNSLDLLKCTSFILEPQTVYLVEQLIDVHFETTTQCVPQADDLNKIFELVTLINTGCNSVNDIADYFVFDIRQSNYYGEAAEYLGLITRSRGFFELSSRGVEFMMLDLNERQVYLAKLIVNSWIIVEMIHLARKYGYFTKKDVLDSISSVKNSDGEQRYTVSTILRRMQTIISWIKWLTNTYACFQTDSDDRFFLV